MDICKTCEGAVAPTAKTCPHCGQAKPGKATAEMTRTIYLVIGAALAGWWVLAQIGG